MPDPLARPPEPHREGTSTLLSDFILGSQDGLVNVLGILLGLAAASADLRLILVGGLAATFAESISMGAVAYTSTIARRDFYRAEMERERREMRELPDIEREEVREIYRNWGLEGKTLEEVVDKITSNEETWLQVMMADELKLQPVEETGARKSAILVGFAAIFGSLVPLWPFLFFPILGGIVVSLVTSAIVLFLIGVFKGRITTGRVGRSGLQMALIGIVAALAGFLVGLAFQAPVAP